MQRQFFYVRITWKDGSVFLSHAFQDGKTPDQMVKVCQRDRNVVEAVVVLKPAEPERGPNRAA